MAISLAVDSQQKSTIRADGLSEKLCNYSSTTTEWPFSGYPPSAEFLEMNKQTRSQNEVHTQSNHHYQSAYDAKSKERCQPPSK